MTNVAIVQQLYDAFARRDAGAIRELFDAGIEWIQNEGFPGGGRHVGPDAVLNDVFAKFRVEWEWWRAVVHEWLVAGDTVIALGEYRGTHKATGKSTVAAFAHVYDLRGGRIVRFRQYTDTVKVRQAMTP
jgi:ketosteroid isomerase-like protein